MKFAEIIREAGLNACEFKKTSDITIHLYDGKNRIDTEDTVHYIEPLFKHNEASFLNFKNFLTGLEKETIESMNVKIDIDTVILFYKSPRAIVFFRNPSMSSLDYMD